MANVCFPRSLRLRIKLTYIKYRDPLTLVAAGGYDIRFPEMLLYAGADPTISLEGPPILFNLLNYRGDIWVRSLFLLS
jgi:hypothetical protein